MIVTFTLSLDIKRYPELWDVLENAKQYNERSKVARDLMLKGLEKSGGEGVTLEMLRDLLSQKTELEAVDSNDEADAKLQAVFG